VLTGRSVTWTSLTPSVATVSAAGLITAMAAGSATIQAMVDSKTGSAPVTVSAPSTEPVSSVTVSLVSSSITAGSTTQATAVAKDANGNVLTGRLVAWASLTPSVASVSSTGVVTALAAGTASIQATVETKIGAAGLTVLAAPVFVPSTSHPHEPAGMTVLHTHDGSAVTPPGWFNASGQVSVVNDASAPGGAANVLQLAMSPTTTPGSGSARIDTDPEIGSFAATVVYVALWEKLSPNFKGNNGAGSLKNVIVHTQSTYGGMPSGAFHMPGLGNNPADIDGRIRIFNAFVGVTDHDGIHFDSPDNAMYWSADAGDVLSRGQWHFIENVAVLNARGQLDGSIKTWIDGVLVVQGSGIKVAYDGTQRFTGLELTNVWGGGGTAIAADNYYRFKDIYVSGGFARAGERPDHWIITAHEGSSVSAGSDVHLTAQLVDANGNSVDVCGLQPSFSVTGGATWDYWDGSGVYSPTSTKCEHGRQGYTLHTSKVVGTQHVITVDDYATVNNTAKGDHRIGVSAAITVR
jgi:hypothetical protein